MLDVKKEKVIPSLIDNTNMEKVIIEGIHKAYTINPIKGYELHDNTLDYQSLEDEPVLGFTQGEVSCSANYDFRENPRGFYAKISGGGDKEI